eukprot:scaffold1068_cov167-Amphora_coffeaeformis.AAC.32
MASAVQTECSGPFLWHFKGANRDLGGDVPFFNDSPSPRTRERRGYENLPTIRLAWRQVPSMTSKMIFFPTRASNVTKPFHQQSCILKNEWQNGTRIGLRAPFRVMSPKNNLFAWNTLLSLWRIIANTDWLIRPTFWASKRMFSLHETVLTDKSVSLLAIQCSLELFLQFSVKPKAAAYFSGEPTVWDKLSFSQLEGGFFDDSPSPWNKEIEDGIRLDDCWIALLCEGFGCETKDAQTVACNPKIQPNRTIIPLCADLVVLSLTVKTLCPLRDEIRDSKSMGGKHSRFAHNELPTTTVHACIIDPFTESYDGIIATRKTHHRVYPQLFRSNYI